jgi:hypothetical protein
MRRIPDHGLIEIANLNLDFPPGVSDRPKIAYVAIAANPDRRPLRKCAAFHSFEPLVLANRISPYIGAGGSGHFALANFFQERFASPGTCHTLFVLHDWCFSPGYRGCQTTRMASRPSFNLLFIMTPEVKWFPPWMSGVRIGEGGQLWRVSHASLLFRCSTIGSLRRPSNSPGLNRARKRNLDRPTATPSPASGSRR